MEREHVLLLPPSRSLSLPPMELAFIILAGLKFLYRLGISAREQHLVAQHHLGFYNASWRWRNTHAKPMHGGSGHERRAQRRHEEEEEKC
eukprot:1908341-Rhodomonas_salina.1